MPSIPCGHCKQPRCRLCFLFDHDARYRALWGGGAPSPAAAVAPKPRVTIEELARKRRRCQEAKAAGRPCTEFAAPPATANPLAVATPPPPAPEENMGRTLTWAYGVTTTPARRGKLLPETLASLKAAGFDAPVLFVDGCDHRSALDYEREFSLPVVSRYPFIRTFGNWVLALAELYIRNPACHRYALFQDDLTCVRNLRRYLDACAYPDGEQGRPKGYWNLYTFDFYAARLPRDQTVRRQTLPGWNPAPHSRGLGAVGLVFDRDAVVDLLSHRANIVLRPADPSERSWRNIDGGIHDAMKKQGRQEFVHAPSLVQHRGLVSVMGNRRHPQAATYPGDDFDALALPTRSGEAR